jgi:hypothetical protein
VDEEQKEVEHHSARSGGTGKIKAYVLCLFPSCIKMNQRAQPGRVIHENKQHKDQIAWAKHSMPRIIEIGHSNS